MSESEGSNSSSDGEDIETTGLIATRQKRATAGNLYATLRANLDDEELQKELLAEDEEGDAEDYEGSDKGGDDDDVLESSSDEEDAGPPKDGEQEDLDGEKALKRQERVEAKKKRKQHEARLKIPAWNKKKRVKLADDVKTEDGSTSERPRKKSERANWLPTAADAPIRQSGRSLAVANREIVHANLKQSAERSERQRRVMKDAADREKSKQRMMDLSQEDRLKKCERIERETAKEFGRWEREEAERQRLREEALAAKRKRGVDGSFIRQWSGSVVWEGDKIKVGRVSHGSKNVDDLNEDKEVLEGETVPKDASQDDPGAAASKQPPPHTITPANPTVDNTDPKSASSVPHEPASAPLATSPTTNETHTPTSETLLQGIPEHDAQPLNTPTEPSYTPSAPGLNIPHTPRPPNPSTHPNPPPQPQQLPAMYHGWPPGSHQFPVEQPALPTAPPPPPPVPLVREQAQRTLLMLENFPSLESTTTKRVPKYKLMDTTLESDPIKKLLLPSTFPVTPALTPEQSKYLTSRPRKRAGNEVPLPAAPSKQRCALTSWPAKFQDPKTGLAYADMHQYKAIQRILAGGCAWSGLLGCWVGSSYGLMGRPAKGVPEGFAGGGGEVKKESGRGTDVCLAAQTGQSEGADS